MTEERVSLRQSAVWGAIAFGIALAIVIGVRLEQAALSVTVGVVCGVAASIPTSLLIVSALRWRDARNGHSSPRRGRAEWSYSPQSRADWRKPETVQPPPIVVVTSPTAPQQPQQAGWSGEYATTTPTQREFSVIGDDEIEEL